jgi:hypothetical protein
MNGQFMHLYSRLNNYELVIHPAVVGDLKGDAPVVNRQFIRQDEPFLQNDIDRPALFRVMGFSLGRFAMGTGGQHQGNQLQRKNPYPPAGWIDYGH